MLISFLAAAGLIGPVQTDSLRPYLWQARPIVIFASADDPRLDTQLDRFRAVEADLIDRDNIVVVDTTPDSPLRQRFRPGAFTVVLVGLDGGEKFRRDGLVAPGTLNALVDTMPMRRQELDGSD